MGISYLSKVFTNFCQWTGHILTSIMSPNEVNFDLIVGALFNVLKLQTDTASALEKQSIFTTFTSSLLQLNHKLCVYTMETNRQPIEAELNWGLRRIQTCKQQFTLVAISSFSSILPLGTQIYIQGVPRRTSISRF